MADPIRIPSSVTERRITIADLWNRYDGTHPDSLTIDDDGVDDNVALNNLATIVDTGVDTLFGSGNGEVEVAAMNPDTTPGAEADENEDATAWLQNAWKINKKPTLLRKIGTSGGIGGHVAVKLLPDDRGIRDGVARIVLLDPLHWFAQTHPDDIDEVVAYAIDTKVYDGYGNVVLVKREQHTRRDDGQWDIDWWVTRNVEWIVGMQAGSEVRWVRDPDRPKTVLWPHDFPAIVDTQNLPKPHSAWGRSDLTPDIVHLQETVNRVASDERRTLRYFAHPKPFATGENPESVRQAVEDASIGSTLILPKDSAAGYLQMQSDGLASSAAYRESLTDKMFEVARTPRIAAGKVDTIGALSGVALLILYRPLIAKTATKRDLYGDLIREVSRRLLILGNVGEFEIEVTWPDAIPRNMREEAQTSLDLKDLGVSDQTLLERLGFNPETERARREDQAVHPETNAFRLQQHVDELLGITPPPAGAAPQGVPQESDAGA